MPGEQKMTDAEIICLWMEQKPLGGHATDTDSPQGWWRAVHTFEGKHLRFECWNPRRITLNECHLVEAKLSDEQWWDYELEFGGIEPTFRQIANATAEQKIKALASVLRPVVEPKAGE